MAELIDHLPGQELPVKDVGDSLRQMWDVLGDNSPSESHASQMNVVLHFGLKVTPLEAVERFQSLLRFVQRYPGRIIVLCPSESRKGKAMKAKLFSQCYIGPSLKEMCCCEALMLAYSPDDFGHLANQVSVWLEADLPTYHWFSGVRAPRVKNYFNTLLKNVNRCIYDGSLQDTDYLQIEWPQPNRVFDLSKARLLPIRQSIGQSLSSYDMEELTSGLKRVVVRHAPDQSGEGYHLAEWLKLCLRDVAPPKLNSLVVVDSELLKGDTSTLSMEWEYSSDCFIKWQLYKTGNRSEMQVRLNGETKQIPAHIKALAPEQALAEALFF